VNRLRGLYAVTPGESTGNLPLSSRVEQAIAGGARIIQYRAKGGDPDRRRSEALALLAICHGWGIPLIVNDDLGLAEAIGADGVHLGRDDADPREARRRLGPKAIIGVSCYDSFERARWAQDIGATYAAFGRFFPSATKPEAVPARLCLLRRGRRALNLPLVAIGGINRENAGTLIAAGADLIAVVDGVFGQPDIRASALALSRLFSREVRSDDPIP